jgi:transitional endoplasmic reticulum ATPase
MNDGLDKDARWEELKLPKEFREKVTPLCNLLRALDNPPAKMALPKGVMLWGPPEIDKRRIARAFANESRLFFLTAGIADLRVGLGHSGRKVEELFVRARGQAPCMLFIDELDNS